MTKDKKLKQLASEIAELADSIKNAELPMDLANKIKNTCSGILDGKDNDKVIEAFLIIAFEAKMNELKDPKDNDAVNCLCDLMKSKAAYVFDVIGSAILLNNIINNK